MAKNDKTQDDAQQTPTPVPADTPTAPAIVDPEIARVSSALGRGTTQPSPAADDIPARKKGGKPGAYIVTAFCGELHHDGRTYLVGDEVQLHPAAAKALGKHVEPASK